MIFSDKLQSAEAEMSAFYIQRLRFTIIASANIRAKGITFAGILHPVASSRRRCRRSFVPLSCRSRPLPVRIEQPVAIATERTAIHLKIGSS
jgi:hypothetical protein